MDLMFYYIIHVTLLYIGIYLNSFFIFNMVTHTYFFIFNMVYIYDKYIHGNVSTYVLIHPFNYTHFPYFSTTFSFSGRIYWQLSTMMEVKVLHVMSL